MKYYVIGKPTDRGIVLRPTGDGFNDGKMVACPGALLVEPGNSFEDLTWEELVAAAAAPGYIDV